MMVFLGILIGWIYASEGITKAIVFVTPSLFIKKELFIKEEIEYKKELLSILGHRQSYLIGRELRQRYIGSLLSQFPTAEEIVGASGTDTVSSQTAVAVLSGLLLPGTGKFIKKDKLLKKAVPPDTTRNYSQFNNEIRDAALYRYANAFSVQSLVSTNDFIHHPEKMCPSIIKAIAQSDKKLCSKNKYRDACQELHKACPPESFGNKTDNDTYYCYHFVLSAKAHSIKLSADVSQKTMDIIKELCYMFSLTFLKYSNSITYLMAQSPIYQLFEHFSIPIKKTKLSVLVISELQMQALILLLPLRENVDWGSQQSSLGIKNYGSTYGSILEFKLNNHQQVKVYWNNQVLEFKQSESIELGFLLQHLQPFFLQDLVSACYNSHSADDDFSSTLIFIVLLCTLCLSGGAIFILFVYNFRKKNDSREGSRLILVPEEEKEQNELPEALIEEEGDDNFRRPSEAVIEAINLSERLSEENKQSEIEDLKDNFSE